MPTENKRVATYLPKHIEERLEAFKVERGLKGDSPALITILSEFFEVSQEVGRVESSEVEHLSRRIETVEQRIAQLKNDIFDELPGELKNLLFFWKIEFKSELLSELRSELSNIPSAQQPEADVPKEVDGQLSFLETLPTKDSESDTPRELPVSQTEELKVATLKPLTGIELSERLGLNKGVVSKMKTKKDPQQFAEWSKSKDPNGLAWAFQPNTKLYHPILLQQEKEEQVEVEEF